MSDNILKYRDYVGSIEVSIEENTLYGKILHIEDLITYESGNVTGLHEAFINAVDEYLKFCNEHDKQPDVPFKGSLNVRIGADLHRKAAIAARSKGLTLNDFIKTAVLSAVENDTKGQALKQVTQDKLQLITGAKPRLHAGYRQKAVSGVFESEERSGVKWQSPVKSRTH